jgi:hypothetical protein
VECHRGIVRTLRNHSVPVRITQRGEIEALDRWTRVCPDGTTEHGEAWVRITQQNLFLFLGY